MVNAIDPGTNESAYIVWDGATIVQARIMENDTLRRWLQGTAPDKHFYIEMVASYGMAVGREVFETCVWIGRFHEALQRNGASVQLIYRRDVKLHHCGDSRAKDSNIRQALIDRFGDKGTKRNPGITYGLSKDLWSAFAIAVYAYDKFCTPQPEPFVYGGKKIIAEELI